VTTVAVRVRDRKLIVVGNVAIRAGLNLSDGGGRQLVRSGKRPAGDAVVEGCRGPINSVVAGRAVRGSKGCASRGVRRVVRALPGRQMAASVAAIRRLNFQCVIVVDVAGTAHRNFSAVGNQLMRVDQREAGGAVIKSRAGPVHGAVARGALRGRKTRRKVVRDVSAKRRSGIPGRLVAAVAVRIRHGESVVVIDVAIRTLLDLGLCRWRHLMRARQRPARGAVVEGCRGPRNCAVAGGAIGSSKRGTRSGVRRVIRALPCCQVATGISAVRRGNLQVVIVVDVAESAGHIGVAVGQVKAGGAVVEAGGRAPSCRGVAGRALRDRETGWRAGMRRIIRLVISREVATGVSAISGGNLQMIVVSDVAAFAGHVRVTSRQREVDRCGSVISTEACTQPTIKFMAALAVGGGKVRAGAGMWRIGGVLPIL